MKKGGIWENPETLGDWDAMSREIRTLWHRLSESSGQLLKEVAVATQLTFMIESWLNSALAHAPPHLGKTTQLEEHIARTIRSKLGQLYIQLRKRIASMPTGWAEGEFLILGVLPQAQRTADTFPPKVERLFG